MDYDLDEEDAPSWWFSSRLGLAVFAFFGLMSMTSQRVCMSIAMICMVNQSTLGLDPSPVASGLYTNYNRTVVIAGKPGLQEPKVIRCSDSPVLFPENLTLVPKEGEFDWSDTQQDVILGTYYWGYLVSQVPLGYVATRFGTRFVFGGMMLVASVTTALIPLAARTHYFILILLRFLGGFCVGVGYPAMHAVWGRWAPPLERSRLVTVGFAGAMFGHVITYPLSAVLCRFGFDGGWAFIFYLFGGLGGLWSVMWIMFSHDSPITHARIDKYEKRYIIQSLNGETDLVPKSDFSVPWLQVLTNLPFLAIVISSFTLEWGFYTFEISIPYYMNDILLYDIREDPVMSVFPYIGLWCIVCLSGIWADKLQLREVLNTATTRKIMQCIGSLTPAALLVAMGFLDCRHVEAAISIMVIGMSFCGFQFSGFIINHLDIAPRFAGVLIGISNAVGGLAHIVAPILSRVIISENTQEQWQTVFFISASFMAFGALCFTVCGSGDMQDWAWADDYDYDTDMASDESDSASDFEFDSEVEHEDVADVEVSPATAIELEPEIEPELEPEKSKVKPRPATPPKPDRRKSGRKISSTKRPSLNDLELQKTPPQNPKRISSRSRKKSTPEQVEMSALPIERKGTPGKGHGHRRPPLQKKGSKDKDKETIPTVAEEEEKIPTSTGTEPNYPVNSSSKQRPISPIGEEKKKSSSRESLKDPIPQAVQKRPSLKDPSQPSEESKRPSVYENMEPSNSNIPSSENPSFEAETPRNGSRAKTPPRNSAKTPPGGDNNKQSITPPRRKTPPRSDIRGLIPSRIDDDDRITLPDRMDILDDLDESMV